MGVGGEEGVGVGGEEGVGVGGEEGVGVGGEGVVRPLNCHTLPNYCERRLQLYHSRLTNVLYLHLYRCI